ncbi:hypothetical protein MPER_16099, partial [Moniliophthora perniciosa FA553]
VYNIVRPPRSNSVLAGSTKAGEIYDSFDPNNFDTLKFVERLKGQWEPVWTYDVRKEAESCIQRLYNGDVFGA